MRTVRAIFKMTILQQTLFSKDGCDNISHPSDPSRMQLFYQGVESNSPPLDSETGAHWLATSPKGVTYGFQSEDIKGRDALTPSSHKTPSQNLLVTSVVNS